MQLLYVSSPKSWHFKNSFLIKYSLKKQKLFQLASDSMTVLVTHLSLQNGK